MKAGNSLKARKSIGHWAFLTIFTLLLAGIRISELQSLDVSAIDLPNDQILIKSAYNRKIKRIQQYPKQGKWARIPIATPLKEELIKAIKGKEPGDFVCEGPNGGTVNHSSFTGALKSLCKKAGVPIVTPHGLRHSCTELYISAGANAEDIRRLLNHSSVSTTMRYIHRTDERLKTFAQLIGKEI